MGFSSAGIVAAEMFARDGGSGARTEATLREPLSVPAKANSDGSRSSRRFTRRRSPGSLAAEVVRFHA